MLGNLPPALLALVLLAAGSGALGASVGTPERAGVPPDRVEGVATIEGDGPAANAVVYLVPESIEAPTAAAEPSDGGVYYMDQLGLRFDPHVLVVPRGAVIEFMNSDQVLHNIFAPPLQTEGFDLGTWPQGETRRHTFEEPGVYVLLCAVHPDMEAFIVVVPTRHYALTDANGSFSIDGLAPGRYRLFAWHERCGPYESVVDIGAGGTSVEIDMTVTGHRRSDAADPGAEK